MAKTAKGKWGKVKILSWLTQRELDAEESGSTNKVCWQADYHWSNHLKCKSIYVKYKLARLKVF